MSDDIRANAGVRSGHTVPRRVRGNTRSVGAANGRNAVCDEAFVAVSVTFGGGLRTSTSTFADSSVPPSGPLAPEFHRIGYNDEPCGCGVPGPCRGFELRLRPAMRAVCSRTIREAVCGTDSSAERTLCAAGRQSVGTRPGRRSRARPTGLSLRTAAFRRVLLDGRNVVSRR